ncbi:carbonate dehydratase, partial [Haematococcus lacustris]
MCRNESAEQLRHLSLEDQVSKLCELNVLRQTFHVCSSPVVQAAWDAGQQLAVYGVIYSLKDGKLASLAGPLTGLQDLDIDSRGVWVRDIKSDMKALPCPPPVLQSKAEAERPPSSPESVLAAQQALNTEALSSRLAQHTAWAGDGSDSHPFSVSPGSASPPQRTSTALELLSLAAVQLKGAAGKTLTQDGLDLVSRGAGAQEVGSAGWQGSPALHPPVLSSAK